MENRLIFLSMAAIDEKRAEENQWLPDDLFPLVTHRIAASGRSDDSCEFAGRQGKCNAGQCLSFTLRCVIGIGYIF